MSQEVAPLHTRAFALALQAAQRAIGRRSRLLRLVTHGYRRLVFNQAGLLPVRGEVQTLLRLVQAWARGEYRTIPWRSLLYSVAALVYFVNPADLIPDIVVGLGLVDDVAVIAAVTRALQSDLERFRLWESTRKFDVGLRKIEK
jgi:uncharacterized membrane protein YkvA (DUF1232 family)